MRPDESTRRAALTAPHWLACLAQTSPPQRPSPPPPSRSSTSLSAPAWPIAGTGSNGGGSRNGLSSPAPYRRSGSVRDRDRLRGEHLQRLGWGFHRLWSTNWFYDAKAEVTKLRDAYDRAVAAADEAALPPAPPAPVPPAPEPPRPEEPAAAPGQELDISRPGPVTRSSP